MAFSKNSIIQWIIAIVFIFCMYWFLGFNKALFYRPISIHQSAQCSRASIALNYYKEGMNFFKPSVHGCRATNGITGCEFPLVNYGAALCYKLFGFNEFWFRFLMLLFVSAGILFAIKLALFYTNNFYIAFFASIIWYLSPVLVYYTPNFNPDPASLGLTMISWYFFFSYLKTRKISKIIFWATFLALAALLKVLSLISLVTIGVLIGLDMIRFFKLNISKKHILYFTLSAIFICIVTIAWYQYANYLTTLSGNKQFSLHAPEKEKTIEYIQKVWEHISWEWVPYYYSYVLYWFLGLATIFLSIFWKSVSRLLAVITILLYMGMLAVFYLMMPQFPNHDYYVITLLPAVFFHISTTVDALQKVTTTKLYKMISLSIFGVLCCFSMIHAKNHQLSRYGGLYYSWDSDFAGYYNLEPEIRKLGITRDEKFASFADWTPNNTLYLIDQKGWTIGDNGKDMKSALNDCKYALINDTSIIFKPELSHFFNKPIAVFKNNIVLFLITHTDTSFDKTVVLHTLDSLWQKYKTIISCSFETMTNNQSFTCNLPNYVCKGSVQANLLAHNGKHSIEIPAKTKLEILAIPNKWHTMSVSIYAYKNPQAQFIISSKKKWGEIAPIISTESSGWQKLYFTYTKRYLTDIDTFHFMLQNNDSNPAYFDDLQIQLIE